jgi:hypothetical protein
VEAWLMGETSVYYVPADEERWIGREQEVVRSFWAHGIFVLTPDRWVYDEIARFKKEGRALPEWQFTFSFAEMGLGGLGEWEPVPNVVYDQQCPHCRHAITETIWELWQDESPIPLPERTTECPSCSGRVGAKDGISQQPFTFSRFYLWVADIDEADWQPSFKAEVETVLGPCSDFQAWET